MVFCAVVEQIIVGDGDGTTFFETLDFGIITKTGVFRSERALGASGEPGIT